MSIFLLYTVLVQTKQVLSEEKGTCYDISLKMIIFDWKTETVI